MTPEEAVQRLGAFLAARSAEDALERAVGWVVQLTHSDDPGTLLQLYGPFQEPAAALSWAAETEAELNEDEEEGRFLCLVLPLMPVR